MSVSDLSVEPVVRLTLSLRETSSVSARGKLQNPRTVASESEFLKTG